MLIGIKGKIYYNGKFKDIIYFNVICIIIATKFNYSIESRVLKTKA